MNSQTTFMQDIIEKVSVIVREYPWTKREAYAQWLAQTHYVTTHSTRLLAAAASRFSIADTPLHFRHIDHMKEEKGHQLMCLSDLKRLGYSIEEFPELPLTKVFWQSQYYQIERIDPICLLGYIICLEGVMAHTGGPIYENLKLSFGAETTTFAKLHTQEDGDHVKHSYELLTKLTPERQNLVLANFEHTATLYMALIRMLASNEKPLARSLKAMG